MRIDTILTCSDFALRRITLDIPIIGFRDFITPWLITETASGRTILIDPGPSCGIPSLKRALAEAGVAGIDLVLLTHIHIDHAGGTGHLLKYFDEAEVVVHSRGRPHLIDPSKLWSGTIETLGKDIAYAYGEMVPVPRASILAAAPAPEALEIVDTPGHSQHHQSYLYHSVSEDLLFEGEAAGVYLGNGYLRPATPPRFFYETSVRSICALRERAGSANLMLNGHRGYSKDVSEMLDAALGQMALWKEVTEALAGANRKEVMEEIIDRSVEHLMEVDPNLSGLRGFSPDVRERETYFLRNSARGFVSAYLERGRA